LPSWRARLRVIVRDPFGAFARSALIECPRRICVVSPWVCDRDIRVASLGRLAEHAAAHGAALVLVTRPPTSDHHQAAIELIRQLPGGRVFLNPRLHGKLYVCESGKGRGVAVVGSANCTDGSAWLDELGLLVRPERGSQIVHELGSRAVWSLMGASRRRR
jgi:hypothetical protein